MHLVFWGLPVLVDLSQCRFTVYDDTEEHPRFRGEDLADFCIKRSSQLPEQLAFSTFNALHGSTLEIALGLGTMTRSPPNFWLLTVTHSFAIPQANETP